MPTYQELVANRKQLAQQREALRSQADTVLSKDNFDDEADRPKVDQAVASLRRLTERIALADEDIAEALRSPAVRDIVEPPEGVPGASAPSFPATTRPAHGKKGPYGSLAEQAMDVYRADVERDPVARERLTIGVAHSLKDWGFQAASGQNIAIDSEGGFLVQTDFAREIWQKMHAGGQVLSRVTPLFLNPGANSIDLPGVDETSRVDGSRWGGVRAYWVNEGGTLTTSTQKYFKVQLKLKKLAALIHASSEMLAHVQVMESLLGGSMVNEMRFAVEDAIFEGDGSGKPNGVLNAAAAIQVAKETNQAAATILHANLVKMWSRRFGNSPDYVWFIEQDAEPALDDLAKVIGTAGVEPNYVTYGPDGVLRIKGRAVVTVEYSATLGTVGDIMLVDLSQYAYITTGIQQAASIHFKFNTDEQSFRTTMSVDGALRWKEALTPFKGTNTRSPVVKLATRA